MSFMLLSKKPEWVEAFWSRVDRSDPDKCWLWVGGQDGRGYGQLRAGHITIRSHRLAWILTNGPIPDGPGHHGTCVLHRCDTPLCCNPEHLFLGTQADNMADMKAKQRRKGKTKHEANGRAKLTPEQVSEIRAHSLGKHKLARMYGVSPAQIQRIRALRQWV